MLKSFGEKRTVCLLLYNIEVIYIILHVCMCVVGRSVEGTLLHYLMFLFLFFRKANIFYDVCVYAALCGSSFYGVSKESTV